MSTPTTVAALLTLWVGLFAVPCEADVEAVLNQQSEHSADPASLLRLPGLYLDLGDE